jgi:peroxiredoxin family protein
MYGCMMAMDMMDIKKEDLVPQIKDVITARDFFEKADGAQTIFI